MFVLLIKHYVMKRKKGLSFLFLLCIGCTTSCVSTKSTTYFNNAVDTTMIAKIQKNVNSNHELNIQKNDILNITISSLNQDATSFFNTSNNFLFTSANNNGIKTQSTGYLVNDDGFVQLPMLGNVKAAGLTKEELKENITNLISENHFLLDPIVNIRLVNYEVTVIGEVNNPTVISVPNEKISMLKAIGLAGDITIYGKKDKVLLIRELDSIKEVKYIDLNSKEFLSSPYYYLKPNDIVYVQANKNKVASVGRGTQLLPVFLSGLSVSILLIDRVFFK